MRADCTDSYQDRPLSSFVRIVLNIRSIADQSMNNPQKRQLL
jgi:hypothetical protein